MKEYQKPEVVFVDFAAEEITGAVQDTVSTDVTPPED